MRAFRLLVLCAWTLPLCAASAGMMTAGCGCGGDTSSATTGGTSQGGSNGSGGSTIPGGSAGSTTSSAGSGGSGGVTTSGGSGGVTTSGGSGGVTSSGGFGGAGGSTVDPCAGVTCSPLDQCHAAGVCDPGTGQCTDPEKADGVLCDDGATSTECDTCAAGACTGGVLAGPNLIFSDTFDCGLTSWTKFEEPVNGNLCYCTMCGAVEQTTDQQQSGVGSLLVHANVVGSLKSDHVLAQKGVSTINVDVPLRYTLWAKIDPEAGNGYYEGQTGPEFSLQRTRDVPGEGWRTMTAGIQYISNKWDQTGDWKIWSDTGGGAVGWKKFEHMALEKDVWYRFVLEVDYATSTYLKLEILDSVSGVVTTWPLAGNPIVHELKFSEDALQLTLESENAWSACASVFEYRMYYDSVILERL